MPVALPPVTAEGVADSLTCLEQLKTLSAERRKNELALLKIRIDSSLPWLCLSNNTVEWKGLQALPRKTKTAETERENIAMQKEAKVNQE